MAAAGGTAAEAGLRKAQQRLEAAENKLEKAEAALQKAEESDPVDEQRVAKAELGIAKAKVSVAEAKVGVAEAKWEAAPQEQSDRLWTRVESAQRALETLRAAAPPHGRDHDQFAANDAPWIQRILRQMERLELAIVSPVSFLPSSSHDPNFVTCVADFYGGRKCCLTGVEDTGPGGGLEQWNQVIAAHIIRTSEPALLLRVNESHPDKEFLTFQSPRDAILLQKKWEVLFDLHCWCLFPSNALSSDPVFKVLVVADANDTAKLSLLQTSRNKAYPLDLWINQLAAYEGKTVSFSGSKTPSFRALSVHARQTVIFAKAMRWIDDAQEAALQVFGELSPAHSLPVSESNLSEG